MALRSGRLVSLVQPARAFSCSASHPRSSNGDYLHETTLPMHHFQRSLPRLPVPKLEDSCRRYLDSQKALMTDDEFASHKQLVESFEKGVGADLHKELVAQDRKNKHTSYITDYWFDMYLKARTPLPLNYNPFIAFTDDTNPGATDQVTRAATLLSSAARFLRTYRDGKLQPELYHMSPKDTDNDRIKKRLRFFPEAVSWYGAYLHKVFPLDMSQYTRLFNSTRVPRKDQDELVSYHGRRHVAVLSKGNFYTFDLLQEDGSAAPVSTIHACLSEIAKVSAAGSENTESIACLTTDDRDEWAAARISLVADPQNAENLELIDSAILMLVLEDSDPTSIVELSNTFLFGKAHSKWFDKSLQLIVCPGGKAAVNFEHSWGDGVAVLRFLTEVYEDVKKHPYSHPVETARAPVRPLSFTLDSGVKTAIAKATKRFDLHTKTLRMETIQFPGMNKDFLKKKKLSGDAILQFSLQLAFFRQYGYTPATYESCSTAAFKHGRTETVRPATVETVASVAAFQDQVTRGKPAQLRDFINKASDKHSQLIKEAATGKGFDRHLFAMKQIAAASGTSVDLFESQPHQHLNHIVLSTSTLSSPAVLLGGFAPVVPDGFGVGYRVDSDCIASQVTAYDGQRDPAGFISALESSLRDIQAVFEAE